MNYFFIFFCILDKIQITVNYRDTKVEGVFKLTDTIADVKRYMEGFIVPRVNEQVLRSSWWNVLNDEKTLQESNVGNGAVLSID